MSLTSVKPLGTVNPMLQSSGIAVMNGVFTVVAPAGGGVLVTRNDSWDGAVFYVPLERLTAWEVELLTEWEAALRGDPTATEIVVDSAESVSVD